MEPEPQKFFLKIIGALFLLNILVWFFIFDIGKTSGLEVNFFDVGQGDAVFIETPDQGHGGGQQILIDGGPDSVILEKLAREMPFWDRTIDLIILSHPESDHLAGLLEVLKRYRVKNILWTGVVRDTAEYREWLELIDKEKANIKIAKAGQEIILPKVVLEILHPFEDWQGKELKDSNHSSIVLRLAFEESSFLFTGDIYNFQEREMILREANIDSDILKVAHHGSKTSSSEEFIEKVSPEIAIIQVGKDNSYGHPRQETLETLNKYGIKIFRTDQDGDIKIISDGANYSYIRN